jgi:integrase
MSSPTNQAYSCLTFNPYQKFVYALRAKESQHQYPKRLQIFLKFLEIKGDSIEIQSNKLFEMIEKNTPQWLENELLKFFTIQNQRAENQEISVETIRNYLKPVKLFCEMNGIIINWKIISKGILRGNRCSSDRPPTRAEIKKLLEYPDRRIAPIVLTMISSGIRVGSWEHIRWGDISPIVRNDTIIAARIKVLNTKTNRYYISFITSEAYHSIKDWMDFRHSFGEKISDESWVMRNLWQIKSQRYGNYLGLAKHPKKFSVDGIRMLINDAWKIQGIREDTKKGNRFAFKSLHGFRKFFETETQKVMKSINVSILMSHDTGIVQHYYKPKEEELLNDYLNAIELLTMDSDNIKLNKQIQDLLEKNQNNEYIIKGKLQEKDEEMNKIKKDAIDNESLLSKLSERISSLEKELKNEKIIRLSFANP